ncbi:MAG TPA: BT4734/BF3469 family protein [Pedobacter sp.]|jgi:hypothetical protein
MAVSRSSILARTHYGLNIFSRILQEADGDAILSLRGRDCNPIANPFRQDSILKIQIINNVAVFSDLNNPGYHGDAFEFAAEYYKLDGQELLDKLNTALYLRLDINKYEEKNKVVETRQAVSAPQVSYFKAPVTNTFPSKSISLTDIYNTVKSDNFREATEALQRITDKKEARQFKATHFDYVTFSGVFSSRSDRYLLKHSGLLTIDFDHLEEPQRLKGKLLEDEYFDTQLLFQSPSGDGLKWIIPIDLTRTTHSNYFKAIAAYIQHTYNMEVDESGKDISRACFLPHDPTIYISPKYLLQ